MSEAKPEVVVVTSKVKAAIKDAGFNTAGDAVDSLNRYVAWLIGEACSRAAANGRKTVRGYDFLASGDG